ncbi:MAG: putative glycoside hydrolase [candidate division KSB1 bacterium]|nr:putative glycoside hydrolase [candidate division KSB1 bacterium]MDZ7300902.1 putative glycoside hydrolase [candidate division KSB1 bacterium]MDZ7314054.1 putative glycoside hydrolase [candidate division KSB1 bacterium]
MRSQRSNKIQMGGAIFLLLLLPNVVFGQIPNHTYPRIAMFQWGGAPAERYAKFDLNVNRDTDRNFISQVKQLSPNTIWLPMRDFNRADEGVSNFPEDWFLHDSRGNRIELYSSNTFWANLSDLCPRYSGNVGGISASNQRLIDWFPEYLAKLVEESGGDGISSDGLYYRGHLSYYMFDDVDLDRNRVNDLTEHDKSWVIDHWGDGIDYMLDRLRSLLGENKIILINTGSADMPNGPAINGLFFENSGGEVNWDYTRTTRARLHYTVRDPQVFLMNLKTDPSNPKAPRPTRNDFQYVRFGLARAMLFGEYFDVHTWEAGEHYWSEYYDEFDLDVGHPVSDMQEVKPGVWVRFFTKGAIIANANDHEVTVTDEDLRSRSGYSGPYWRFQGGQDPALNNGQKFTSVQLSGHFYLGYHDARIVVGDGLVLVTSPQTVIADIIVDNAYSGTSAGSSEAHFAPEASWKKTSDGSDHYSLTYATWQRESYATAITTDASATAVFTPNIGFGGKYEVFEWHGRPNNASAASNATYLINHAGGRATKTINQRNSTGQWNSLGTYTFNGGTSGNVTILSNGADGLVLADAIKFVFRGGNGERDTSPPAAPQNVKIAPAN